MPSNPTETKPMKDLDILLNNKDIVGVKAIQSQVFKLGSRKDLMPFMESSHKLILSKWLSMLLLDVVQQYKSCSEKLKEMKGDDYCFGYENHNYIEGLGYMESYIEIFDSIAPESLQAIQILQSCSIKPDFSCSPSLANKNHFSYILSEIPQTIFDDFKEKGDSVFIYRISNLLENISIPISLGVGVDGPVIQKLCSTVFFSLPQYFTIKAMAFDALDEEHRLPMVCILESIKRLGFRVYVVHFRTEFLNILKSLTQYFSNLGDLDDKDIESHKKDIAGVIKAIFSLDNTLGADHPLIAPLVKNIFQLTQIKEDVERSQKAEKVITETVNNLAEASSNTVDTWSLSAFKSIDSVFSKIEAYINDQKEIKVLLAKYNHDIEELPSVLRKKIIKDRFPTEEQKIFFANLETQTKQLKENISYIKEKKLFPRQLLVKILPEDNNGTEKSIQLNTTEEVKDFFEKIENQLDFVCEKMEDLKKSDQVQEFQLKDFPKGWVIDPYEKDSGGLARPNRISSAWDRKKHQVIKLNEEIISVINSTTLNQILLIQLMQLAKTGILMQTAMLKHDKIFDFLVSAGPEGWVKLFSCLDDRLNHAVQFSFLAGLIQKIEVPGLHPPDYFNKISTFIETFRFFTKHQQYPFIWNLIVSSPYQEFLNKQLTLIYKEIIKIPKENNDSKYDGKEMYWEAGRWITVNHEQENQYVTLYRRMQHIKQIGGDIKMLDVSLLKQLVLNLLSKAAELVHQANTFEILEPVIDILYQRKDLLDTLSQKIDFSLIIQLIHQKIFIPFSKGETIPSDDCLQEGKMNLPEYPVYQIGNTLDKLSRLVNMGIKVDVSVIKDMGFTILDSLCIYFNKAMMHISQHKPKDHCLYMIQLLSSLKRLGFTISFMEKEHALNKCLQDMSVYFGLLNHKENSDDYLSYMHQIITALLDLDDTLSATQDDIQCLVDTMIEGKPVEAVVKEIISSKSDLKMHIF